MNKRTYFGRLIKTIFISLIILIPFLSFGQIDKKYIYNKWFGTIKGHHDTLILKALRDVNMETDCPGMQSGIIEFRKDNLALEYSWQNYLNDEKKYDFIARWAWKEDKDGLKIELTAKKNKEIRKIEMKIVSLNRDRLVIANTSDKKEANPSK